MKQSKGYKRSWKNLLLNKRYQLRFTLTMVGLSAVLMGLLGWWVMTVAERATKVAINNVLGEEVCRDPSLTAVPPAGAVAPGAEAAEQEPEAAPAAEDDTGAEGATAEGATDEGAAEGTAAAEAAAAVAEEVEDEAASETQAE
ncbi:MAG TPA: hypothetical protein VKZ63_15910, partial [Kofleriaceae bacterium]|nr:hypothetical protein [Kofleriaceae bacterium]